MKDLKLCRNRSKRVEVWKVFEQVADDNPVLYDYLKDVKKIPEKYNCELCFLINLLSEEIMPQLQGKITNEEASAVVSIYWGSMERKNACDCNIKDIFESINEIERQNMEH